MTYPDTTMSYEQTQQAIERSCALYAQLDALSLRQHELIAAGDIDSLLAVLADRQIAIDQIQQISNSLAPVRARWETFLSELTGVHRDEITRRIELIESLAAKVSARDDRDRERLETLRKDLKAEQSTAGRARDAVVAYAGPQHTGPRLQDQEG